jgi:thiamine pyrophosphokinase
MNSTVILANGLFPTSDRCLDILKNAGFIICCDGATQKLTAAGYKPDIIIGDLDSLADDIRERYANIIHHIPDQDTNDLTKAVMWATKNGHNNITVLGATGLREDHSIGNFFLLTLYAEWCNIKMVTDYGTIYNLSDTKTFDTKPKQQVSIFTTQPDTRITTEGLKYPLTNQTIPMPWQGTLNQAQGDRITVTASKPGVLIYILN